MKRIFWIMIFGLLIGAAHSNSTLPNRKEINFTLSQIEQDINCPTILNNAKLVIDYDYNFERNMGLAHLRELQSSHWNEILHPLGLTNYYAFMSDMKPKTIQLNNGDLTIYRIIFHLYNNGDAKVFMMLGVNGDCIMSSNTVNVMTDDILNSRIL